MSRVLVSMLNASVISSSSGYSLLLCQLSFHICTFCIFSLSHCLHCFCLYLWILPYFKKKMHRNGGNLKECLRTSKMDTFAKSKAQPAKKCLFSFYFYVLLSKHELADGFSLLCTNLEINQSFHCWSNHPIGFPLYSSITYCRLENPSQKLPVQNKDGIVVDIFFKTMSSLKYGRVSRFYKCFW